MLTVARGASVCVAGALILCALAMPLSTVVMARAEPTPARVAADFGGDCRAMAVAYDVELEVVSRCSHDDDCRAELRGGNKMALDGCWRFVNRHVSRAHLDALSAVWVNSGCPSQFAYCRTETCRELAGPVCRAGRCVDRTPDGIPTDWVRHEVAAWFSFFAPADIEIDPRTVRPGEKARAEDDRMRVSRVYLGKGLLIEIEYPSHWTAESASRTLDQDDLIETATGATWRIYGEDPYDRWQLFGVRHSAHPPLAKHSSACFTSRPLDIRVRCYNANACVAARQIRDSVTFESGML